MQVFIIGAAMIASIMCGVGVFCRRKDIFSMLNHPLVKKHPNISKTFGTYFICFAILWFLGVVGFLLSL